MKTWQTRTGIKITRILGGRSNVFLVSNGKINLLTDTSPAFMRHRLMKRLDQFNVKSIDFLILTHTHFDHAANACQLKEKFGLKVIVHKTEAGFLNSGDSPIPAGTNTFTRWLVRNAGEWFRKMVRYKSCNPDQLIHQNFSLLPFGINAEIIHTPGHSDGSICLVVDNEIALVGDTLIGTFPRSCFPPFADNKPALIKSWQILIKTGCSLFLPSHGSARTHEFLKKNLRKRLNIS